MTFASAGVCIYCGAKEYAPGSYRQLAEEHIIPLGIGGKFVLPEASCQKCERITGRIESIALNSHLMGPRRHMGLRGRTPKSKDKKELPVFVPRSGGRDEKVMIPIADYPSVLSLLKLPDPPILERLKGIWRHPEGPVGVFVKWFNYDEDKLREKYGLTDWASPAMDLHIFCRMLAKIGHSYAVATLGLDAFDPLLIDPILKEDADSARALPFVGGMPDTPPQRGLHFIRDGTVTVADIHFVVVEIRLFAQFGAPRYVVVVGTKGKRPSVLPTGIPIGGHVPHSISRVHVPPQSGRPK